MKRLLLLATAGVLGTLAVSAYRNQPDGIFARFKAWARPWIADHLGGAAEEVTSFVAGILEPEQCSFACSYGSGGGGPLRTIATAPPDRNGLDAVGEIMSASGLVPNFKLLTGNVPNASAFVQDGERVIVYSKAWMDDLGRSVPSKWTIYAVLAHEIGHHLNGDTMPRAGSYADRDAAANHGQELAADYFAGFVLAKLGASLDEATSAVRKYAGAESRSHPGRERRIAEHTRGWNEGNATLAPQDPAPDVSLELIRLQQELGRHAEHYGPGHATIDGRLVPCLVQYKLRFVGRTMRVKGVRYDASTRDVAILEWQLDPRDGRPHGVRSVATGVLDGAACHRVTIANAGEFCYSVAPGEEKERDPQTFVRALQRYIELAAR